MRAVYTFLPTDHGSVSRKAPKRLHKVTSESEENQVGANEEGERTASENASPMMEILNALQTRPVLDSVVEGPIIAFGRARVFVDIYPFGTGIIYGREYLSARDTLKNVNIGDTITAKVVGDDNEEGYIELSLREARQAIIWNDAEMAMQKKTVFELPITEANKGGLIIQWNGLSGFLPASQLAPAHYPRVYDGDKDKIFAELKKLVGTKFEVNIITANPKEQKLIFSEKGIGSTERTSLVEKYHVNDVIEGMVTGSTEFGVFVKLEEGLEGLVHISEMDWALVENPKTRYRVGETVKVQVIEVKDGKVSLSIKTLIEDPWKAAAAKYNKDQKVNAVVIKHNKHGALASIEEGVAGLVHISEFANEEELRSKLELGKVYPFVITFFEPKDRRMTLKLVA